MRQIFHRFFIAAEDGAFQLIDRMRRMLFGVHVLDQVALRAPHPVQLGITGFDFLDIDTRMVRILQHAWRMASETHSAFLIT